MSIEAMKEALDALEEINKLSIGENAICLPAEIDTAMDALRQAIEQVEKRARSAKYDRAVEITNAYERAWKAATAEQAEQAVTWDASAPLVVHPHPAFQNTPQCKPLPEDLNSEALETIEIELPDRQSVVLTDEEIWELWVQETTPERTTREFVTAFARAIEATHGIEREK
jgi:hypothetical protein